MCPSLDETPNGVNGQANGHANGTTNGTNGCKSIIDADGHCRDTQTDQSAAHEGYTGIEAPQNPHRPVKAANPYQPVGDFLSNVSDFKIIESTLREGEQFANAYFDTETKIKIAKALDAFGVDCIELTSPCASEQSRADCEAICKLGLKAKILTHVRCHMDDVKVAVETGVDGVDVVIGTSQYLREHSHGKDMTYIKVG